MLQLDVPAIINPILENYNQHVNNFIHFLNYRLKCHLIYEGPLDIQQHILQRSLYACSVHYKPKKILKDVFPIMIGSNLDLAIRHAHQRAFQEPMQMPSVPPPFQDVDIGRGFFIINGFLRQLPYFYTNDPSNTHVIQKKTVRVYTYNACDRGKELSYFVNDNSFKVCHNDGTSSLDDTHFFYHCPYPTHLTAYMRHLYKQNLFDIDHLGNKVIVSPGHLFVRLFIKHLYGPIRDNDWTCMKSKCAQMRKYIEMGDLLHVLSQKTCFFKESTSKATHREIGANGEVFIEKTIGCYREVNMQTYPLNPYLLYIIIRQISKRVKHFALDALPISYEGFLCILGCFETKNVGRTTMMVRNTVVTTSDMLDPVFHDDYSQFWQELNLESDPKSNYYVVVNEACIPVTKASFDRIDLLLIKHTFVYIECYERSNFIVIRFKAGLLMKRQACIWVSAYDEGYWTWRGLRNENLRYEDVTCYMVDLNKYFHHNGFPKNILGFNALKNAVLATNPRYSRYFMDTISAYFHEPSRYHQILLPAKADGVSHHFELWIPRVLVTYASFLGCTQEDCIVQRKDVNAFDCFRFYTLRFKINTKGWIRFYPVRGQDTMDFLGTLVSNEAMTVEPFSIHVTVDPVSETECRLHFSKTPFSVVQHFVTRDKLMICLEQEHISSTGDKLCSFHGQKGVIRIMENVLTLDDAFQPDLIVNPYSLFRMTPGQIIDGKDAETVRNSDGELVVGARALYGMTFYFPIAYWSCEHLYAPQKCRMDKVLGQAVKGRSRGGGMRLGNMELFNALRGNGLASCFEEKFFEDGDRVPVAPTIAIPKSVNLVQEDARFYKCNLKYQMEPSVKRIG